jgi:hypothetical protein
MTTKIEEIKKKYGSLFDLHLIFEDGSIMNICRHLVVLDKQDVLDMLPDLKGVVLNGAPSFLEPLSVIISMFPQHSIIQLRKDILLTFPHFSQSTPWIPHIHIKNAANEEEKTELLAKLKQKINQYVIKEIALVKVS